MFPPRGDCFHPYESESRGGVGDGAGGRVELATELFPLCLPGRQVSVGHGSFATYDGSYSYNRTFIPVD